MAKKLSFLPSVRHSLFSFFASFLQKKHLCKKKSERATAYLFHLPIQAFVATIIKLKARAGIIFRNCEKPNDGNPRKSDKKCHSRSLNADEQNSCEGMVTCAECWKAGKSLKHNKSPGIDGLPGEFYKVFFRCSANFW